MVGHLVMQNFRIGLVAVDALLKTGLIVDMAAASS